jgi:hypothetical protein
MPPLLANSCSCFLERCGPTAIPPASRSEMSSTYVLSLSAPSPEEASWRLSSRHVSTLRQPVGFSHACFKISMRQQRVPSVSLRASTVLFVPKNFFASGLFQYQKLSTTCFGVGFRESLSRKVGGAAIFWRFEIASGHGILTSRPVLLQPTANN